MHTVIKVIDYPVPSREVTKQIPLAGNNLIIPGQGDFFSDFPAGNGKLITFFYSVSSDIYLISVCNIYLHLHLYFCCDLYSM